MFLEVTLFSSLTSTIFLMGNYGHARGLLFYFFFLCLGLNLLLVFSSRCFILGVFIAGTSGSPVFSSEGSKLP